MSAKLYFLILTFIMLSILPIHAEENAAKDDPGIQTALLWNDKFYGGVWPHEGTPATEFFFSASCSGILDTTTNKDQSIDSMPGLGLTVIISPKGTRYMNTIECWVDDFGNYYCYGDVYIKGSDLALGKSTYSFYCMLPGMHEEFESDTFTNLFVSDKYIAMEIWDYYDYTNDKDYKELHLKLSTIPKDQNGIVYLIALNQTDLSSGIYSAPSWTPGITPLATVKFPADLYIEDMLLWDLKDLIGKPPFDKFDSYTFAIAAFDPESYELISNVSTVDLKMK